MALLALPNLPSQLQSQRRLIPRHPTFQAHHRAPPNTAFVPFSSIFPTFSLFYLYTITELYLTRTISKCRFPRNVQEGPTQTSAQKSTAQPLTTKQHHFLHAKLCDSSSQLLTNPTAHPGASCTSHSSATRLTCLTRFYLLVFF